MHEHLGRAVVYRAQLLDPAIAKQLLLDKLAAGVVIAKQAVHLPVCINSMKRSSMGLCLIQARN